MGGRLGASPGTRPREAARRGRAPESRPPRREPRPPAGAILRAKAGGWTTDDLAPTLTKLRANTLAPDAIAASPFKVEVGPDAILCI